jgi:23S rRNA G2445 N2-methylase RlmL
LDLFGSKDSLQKIPLHDFVIVNPPYFAVKKNIRFETSNAGDLYSYFMENIIKTSRGFISITPQSFTNAKKFESLRKLLLSNYPNFKVFIFKHQNS